MSARRRPAPVLLVVAALAAGLIVDHAIGQGTAGGTAAAAAPSTPTASPPGSLSSTWFCPAMQARADAPATGQVLIANPTAGIVTGTVTIVPSSGATVVVHPEVAPYRRVSYQLPQLVAADYAAATVTLDTAGGAVEEEIHGTQGDSITPCATSSSDQWFFAAGHTDRGASELLSLYDPYPAAAIVDLGFMTDIGPSFPDAFQALVVPAGGFTIVDIGSRVRLRSGVATTVHVRSGRVVAAKLQLDPAGASLALGAPAPATVWYYADGASGAGVTERFLIFNPGTDESDIDLAPTLQEGSVEPFTLVVPPGGTATLDVGQQPRIPPGIAQAWTLTATNGAPFVAERVVDWAPASASGAAKTTGVADTTGTPRLAREWIFAAGAATGTADEWIAVFDPGAAAAKVTVTASGAGSADRIGVLDVPPHGRAGLHIAPASGREVVVLDVTSDVPVVAERAEYVTPIGFSDTYGIAGTGGETGGT